MLTKLAIRSYGDHAFHSASLVSTAVVVFKNWESHGDVCNRIKVVKILVRSPLQRHRASEREVGSCQKLECRGEDSL
jgi:hypothetical protein